MNFHTDRYQVLKLLYSKGALEYFLAIRKEDQQKVVLKCLSENHYLSSNATTSCLQSEFSILQQLDHPAIVKAFNIEKFDEKQALVREYFEGVSLHQYLASRPLAIDNFLTFSIKLAEALNAVHQAKIIHCNITPSNILVQPQQQALLLLGFHQAVTEQQANVKTTLSPLDGDKNYWAPEQSGRLAQKVDFRTDIYSLGILFYQMLSSYCPFSSEDSIGLLHNHIAKPAPLLSKIIPETPLVIARIVDKMIAKSPSARYQSVLSLLADLHICHQAFLSDQGIFDFDIGKINTPGQWVKSDKLYGRSREKAQLARVYDKACSGTSVLALLKGEPGVGKSSLISASQQHHSVDSYSINLKFDQFKDNGPYEKLYASLRHLIRILLSKTEETVLIYRRRLLLALAGHGQLIIDVIPEVKILIGPQAVIQSLPPAEAKVRLNHLLCQFIQIFCRIEQPLFIVLDDLQWADNATVEWLEMALFSVSHLLVITAYRPSEINENHGLPLLIKNVQAQNICVESITLKSLPKSVVRQMLADNMHIDIYECDDLATEAYNKTQGNPFFITQYFQQLQEDKLLQFNPSSHRWEYDIGSILKSQLSDNVVDLLSKRLTCLSQPIQHILMLAACIGSKFDQETLQAVTEHNDDVSQYINSALKGGWIIKSSDQKDSSFAFSHDRIQQAAWSLLSSGQLLQAHLRIGRYMRKQAGDTEGSTLLQAVNHLNAALTIIENKDEKLRLGADNFKAGLQAKQTGAFKLALFHLKKSMHIFSDSRVDSAISSALIRERAECEHLCGHNSQAEDFYKQAIIEAPSLMEKAYIYELMIQFYTDLSQFDDAYRMSQTAMKLFNIKLPSHFNPLFFSADFIYLKFQLRRFKINELLDLPETTNVRINIILRLLAATLKVAYQLNPELCVAISVKLVSLCLKHGNTREAVAGYVAFGVIFLGGILGNHQAGYEYGQLCLTLLDKYDNDRQRSETNFVYAYFSNSWTHPASDTEQYWQTAYTTGLEIGDWFHTSCACSGIIQSQFMRGLPLDQVWDESERFLVTLERLGSHEQIGAIISVRQAICNLQGKTISQFSFNDATFNEETFVDSLADYGSRHFAHYYFINKMQSLYLWGYYQEALEISHRSAEYLKDSTGMLHNVEHHFYTALILAKLYPRANRWQKYRWFKSLKLTEKKLAQWAQRCPENFRSRRYLVKGEIYRLQGKQIKSLRCYEKANQAAEIHGHIHLQALANQLTALLYNEIGQPRSAFFYERQADTYYQQWGVNIHHQQPPVFNQSVKSLDNTQGTDTKADIDNIINTDPLDIATLIKSSEAITAQRRLPELLQTLLTLIIENAGAQRGILLLSEMQTLAIQAEATFGDDNISVLQNMPLQDYQAIPHSIINYVSRSREPVVLENALLSSIFSQDDDITNRRVLSVLCAPLIIHGELKGIIYLENNITENVFSKDRIALLQHLSGQIGISIDNALVYQNLEIKVQERTHDIEIQKAALAEKNAELEHQNSTILNLNTQLQTENDVRHKAEKDLQLVNKQLHRLSITDALTQISNRRHFDNFLHQECARLTRNNSMTTPLALLLCDIDYFKSYNDAYGHQTGDDCLIRIAQTLVKAAKRPTDLVARYGGEEFAVIIPQTDAAGAQRLAKNIHQELASLKIPHRSSLVSEYVTVSIGIAIATSSSNYSPDQFFKYADEALYQAKESGRNKSIYTKQHL